ncbi:MAG: STAS domain-containing protein [Planctomycetes bacterium]|nr:STAS domain-containing protein [Planctomycetota bacterium]
MSNSPPEHANPQQTYDLGPLTLAAEKDCWRFTLAVPTEMTLELPPDYEQFLRQKLEPFFQSSEQPTIEMDLQDLPAISSRHLGLMLALQKAIAERYERLRITGISPGVRRLLSLTRIDQFFDVA